MHGAGAKPVDPPQRAGNRPDQCHGTPLRAGDSDAARLDLAPGRDRTKPRLERPLRAANTSERQQCSAHRLCSIRDALSLDPPTRRGLGYALGVIFQ